MFEFISPSTLDEALGLWHERARYFAGGTDLVTQLKAELIRPARLIDVKCVAELHGIAESGSEVRIGPLTSLTDLAASPLVRAEFPALAEACALAASPQLRNVGTLGGNLMQDSRCPYYRGPFDCWLKGGEVCFMRGGENREAAIIGYGPCVHVHASDPLVALAALDATLIVRSAHSIREVPAADLAHAPAEGNRRLTVLYPEELITAVRIPRRAAAHSAYVKAMDRAVWSFALASAAARIECEGDRVTAARVFIGGIAPVPWRAGEAEAALVGQTLAKDLVEHAAGQALPDAQPLAHNRYKVRLARALVKRALNGALDHRSSPPS